MKKIIILMLIISTSVFTAYAGSQVRITLATAMDFIHAPDFDEVIDGFSNREMGQFWGIGWEVIFDHLGIGGNYMSCFDKNDSYDWCVDWYGEVFYLSYHLFGGGAFVDPFAQVGLGSAGRVDLSSYEFEDLDRLNIALFPFVSVGCGLDFDGFLLSAKLNYAPKIGPVPVTPIRVYPLNNFQVVISAGIALGSH
ncbi:MAG: hypothetical protein JW969_15055 [Spirochaetales bacterium]|nr:hypothetical protein [Spirochaetales bacterium]